MSITIKVDKKTVSEKMGKINGTSFRQTAINCL